MYKRQGRSNRGNYNVENNYSANTKPNPFARPEKPVKEQEVADTDQANNIAEDPEKKDNDQATAASSNEDDSKDTSEQG